MTGQLSHHRQAHHRPLELDMISSRWQLALDAAERALGAAQGFLPSPELVRRRRDLTQERQQTAQLLSKSAQVARVRAVPWLSPVPVTTRMLGLPRYCPRLRVRPRGSPNGHSPPACTGVG